MKVRLIFGLSIGLFQGLVIYFFSNEPNIKAAVFQGALLGLVMGLLLPLFYKKS